MAALLGARNTPGIPSSSRLATVAADGVLGTRTFHHGLLGSDFGRFGVALWREVKARDRRNEARQRALGDLAVWRNAIAHQDFTSPDLRPGRLCLTDVGRWRRACDALALHFDAVFAAYLTNLAGVPPW